MARELSAAGLEIGALSPSRVPVLQREEVQGLPQWSVPIARPLSSGLPPANIVDAMVRVCREFKSEIVHIWGTESYLGLLTARGIISTPSVLTVQGIKATVAQHFYGGLSFSERLGCIGIREVLRRNGLSALRKQFAGWAAHEREILAGHRHVICQTPWQAAQACAVRPDAVVHRVELPLRHAFESSSWIGLPARPVIFCSAGYPAPFKGIHTAIRALARLKAQLPDIQLRIGGLKPIRGIKRDGYMHWLEKLADQLGASSNVAWLGRLTAKEICDELSDCSVALIPSYVESYCMAMCEAQRVGVPVVAAYTGGTAYLGQDENSCLFFPAGDSAMCAYQIARILRNAGLAAALSTGARHVALGRSKGIVEAQIGAYEAVLGGRSRVGGGVSD